jgi:hypothetical protein
MVILSYGSSSHFLREIEKLYIKVIFTSKSHLKKEINFYLRLFVSFYQHVTS